MSEELVIKILDTLKVIGPSVILPIVILWLTNRNTRKNRKMDQIFELEKLEKNKSLEVDYSMEANRKKHQIVVHSSLIKILFEVQKLHISLSGKCADFDCIDTAVNVFQKKFSEEQAQIAEFQIYLSSNITNRLYKFYSLLGELLVELKEIKDSKNFEIAIASVYNYSVQLAEEVIEIQEELVKKRKDLKEEFDGLKIPNFTNCCGQEPPKEIQEEYERVTKKKIAITQKLNELPLELENELVLEKENVNGKSKL